MNTKTTKRAVYPNIEIRDFTINGDDRIIEMHTILRKEYKGKYYLINHLQRMQVSPGSKEDPIKIILTRLISEVYNSMHFYILNESTINLKDSFGYPIIILDEDQRTEEERLKSFMLY